MGQISSGVGLVSGINTAQLIEQLLAVEARPKQLIEQRNVVLTSQQVALQDINAKLLSLKLSASGFTDEQVFQTTAATTSDEDVLTVTSNASAVPGSYDFVVDRLITSQQVVTKGFADLDTVPIAPDGGTLTFEFGPAGLNTDSPLSLLNGGEGINRGRIRITDRSGASAIVDLSKALTVNDVLDAINTTSGINVTARVEGDAFQLVDNTGTTTTDLAVSDIGTTNTAASLGLDVAAVGDTLTGSSIHRLSEDFLLSSLNDGNGVRIKSGVGAINDFRVTRQDGTNFDVDLSGAITIGDVLDAINTASGGDVTASIGADGSRIELTDTTAGGGTLSVAASNDSKAALDLGILSSDGDGDGVLQGQRVIAGLNSKLLKNLNGGQGVTLGPADNTLTSQTRLRNLFQEAGITPNGDTASPDLLIQSRSGQTFQIDVDSLQTVGDLINTVNTTTGGLVSLAINGQSLQATNSIIGVSNFQIQDINGSQVATELGLVIDSAFGGPDTVTGNDTDPAVTTKVFVTNRAGNASAIDVSGVETVEQAIRRINDAGAGITASLNSAGNGLIITDTTGGTGDLDLGGDLFDSLNLTGVYSNDTDADSGNLQLRYISEATRLSTLNGGLGVASGRFTIRDSEGVTATVDLSQGEQTIEDVLSDINSRGLKIQARINDNGDGILIEDQGSGALALRVEEAGSTTARDLGILGEADDPGDDLDGSFETTIDIQSVQDLTGTTTLNSLNGGEGVDNAASQDDLRITTRDGTVHNINLDGTVTVDDVISAINSGTGGAVTAAINANSRSLTFTDQTSGSETFEIEAINGSGAAADLGVETSDDNNDGVISGSAIVEIVTLQDLTQRINNAGIAVTATVINDGSAGKPFRLNLTADRAGSSGAFLFDDGGLGFGANTLSEAKNAVVFFGSTDPAKAVAITSADNGLESVIPGVTIDLHAASDTPVRVTITRDNSAIVDAVGSFVERFNEVSSTLDSVDSFNPDTEERGLLLGDPTVARIRSSLFRLVNGRNTDLTGQFSTLAQVGIRVGNGAKLSFDRTKFTNALSTDPEAVEQLFTLKQTRTDEDTNEIITTAAGIGVRIDQLLDRLTDSSNGVLRSALDSLDNQIELGNERIENLDNQIERKRQRLEAEFLAMERSLAQLQNQSTALASFQPLSIPTGGGTGGSILG